MTKTKTGEGHQYWHQGPRLLTVWPPYLTWYEEQAVLSGLVPCSSVQRHGFEQKHSGLMQGPGGTLNQQLEELDPGLTEEVGRP